MSLNIFFVHRHGFYIWYQNLIAFILLWFGNSKVAFDKHECHTHENGSIVTCQITLQNKNNNKTRLWFKNSINHCRVLVINNLKTEV
jgi:hypothetical protein